MITYSVPHAKRMPTMIDELASHGGRKKYYAMVLLENGLYVPRVKLLALRKTAPESAVWRLVPLGVECSWKTPTRRGCVRIQGYELSDSVWLRALE